jgi:hypothetical protein
MALKTLSIEWEHSHPRGCVAALHPGTNDTALSKPFQANVAADALFDPIYTASMFVDLPLFVSQCTQMVARDGVLLASNEMIVNSSTGVQVNPFTRKFSLSPLHSVNYMLSAIYRDT